jgi:hypothetical protein
MNINMENTKYFDIITGRNISSDTALKRINKNKRDKDDFIPVIKQNNKWIENKKVQYNPYSLKFDSIVNIKKQKKIIDKNAEILVKKQNYFKQTQSSINKLIQNKINEVKVDLNILGSSKGIIKDILNMFPFITKNIRLKAGQNYYTLNEKNMSNLVNILNDSMIDLYAEDGGSDKAILQAIMKFNEMTFEVIPPKSKNSYGKNQNGFFKYINKTPIDLTRYDIYDEVKSSNYTDNCFITALKSAELDDKLISIAKQLCLNRYIPLCKLKEFADRLHIYIEVKKPNQLLKFGTPNEKIHIKLGLLEEHIFLIEPVEITSYAIKNWKSLQGKERWNEFIKKKERDKNRFIDSYDLIRTMIEHKDDCLELIQNSQELYSSQYYDQVKDINEIHFTDDNFRLNSIKPKKDRSDIPMIFFDFETYIKKVEVDGKIIDRQTPYLCCINKHKVVFYGERCGKKMLDFICEKYPKNKKITLVAHNCGFDFRCLFSELYGVRTIEKGSGLMSGEGLYTHFESASKGRQVKFSFRCSYRMTDMPLSKFGKAFNLDVKKEILPYDLYTEENVNKEWVDLNECLKYVKVSDQKEYVKNCSRWRCLHDGQVNILAYSAKYCFMDCEVLERGYNKFRNMMKETTGLDIIDYLTIASISHAYLVKMGCYEDVYELSGIVREFIQRCVVGGRTMCANNEKQIVNTPTDDFDAKSLYPSAMCRMKGFLKGKPKIIPTDQLNNKSFYEDKDGYFVKVKITKVGKNRSFPLLSKMTDKGVRMFSNDLIGEVLYLDKTTLEDAKEFQGIEWEVLLGVYYDEGHNPKIRKVMKDLYENRQKYQRDKNPVEKVYKLLMNSSYGKSILKPIETDIKYVKKDHLNDFVNNYYNFIRHYTLSSCGKTYKVYLYKAIDDHFNNAQVGVEILSMSKRIMNEVICLGEDNNIPIYYQDTDSLHLPSNKVKKLGRLFKKEYKRELIGEGTGQFHTDFELNGATDIYAEKSIFLGKKCYIDCLVGKDKNGNEIRGNHIRMKGIPTKSVLYEANKREISPVELYERLYKGESIQFNLLKGVDEEGQVYNTPKFIFGNDMNIDMKTEFLREIKFIDSDDN